MFKRTTLVLLILIQFVAKAQTNYDFELSKSLDIYAELLQKLNLYYVDEIEASGLNQSAVESVLKNLDPYTIYYPESQMEDVAYMHSGKYGGIGASILIEEDTIYVKRVLKAYPFDKAGIKAGDIIHSINGESVYGKTQAEMSDILQGAAGSELKVVYSNSLEEKKTSTTILREEIKVANVPYAAIIAKNIAYVRLDQFKMDAAKDIKKALDSLNNISLVKGVILDLRGNPGGLLQEAVNIIDIFEPAGEKVVETKGKIESQNFVYKTTKKASYPNAKVVVLVNGSSASASEIVAGGLQDLDRGLVIGQKSFGKGLVQKVYPLSYHAQLKITIAKYYIPSGRCIQAIDYNKKDEKGKAMRIPDSLISTFYTKGGRPVKDAGGIVPDIYIEKDDAATITQQFLKQNIYFHFANEYMRLLFVALLNLSL